MKKTLEKTEEIFDLFDTNESDIELLKSSLEQKSTKTTQYWSPKALEKGETRRVIKLRFLPNPTPEVQEEKFFVKKHEHFVKMENGGSFECVADLGKTCPLCTTFWTLKGQGKSDAVKLEQSKLFSKTQNYFSYVQIIDCPNEPELNGQIIVFKYGNQIRDRINGEMCDNKVNVFHPVTGKIFRLVQTPKSTYWSYEQSNFMDNSSRVEYFDNGKWVSTNEDKVRDLFLKELNDYAKELPLSTFRSKEWTPEQLDKVNNIINRVTHSTTIISESKSVEQKVEENDADMEAFFKDLPN